MVKDDARKLARQRRDAIPVEKRRCYEEKIWHQLVAANEYTEAEAVLSYVSFRTEVSTEEINKNILADGKKLYLPRTFPDRRKMEFFRVEDRNQLISGYQGILEPEDTLPVWTGEERTLMVLPGVAFDGRGNRIGYGGGYYDRFLEKNGNKISCRIMLAFEVQRVPAIDRQSFDCPADKIVTEAGFAM